MINEKKLIEIISKAVKKKINPSSKVKNVQKWDSLAQLEILALIDRATKGKSSKIQELVSAKSFEDFKNILIQNNLFKN